MTGALSLRASHETRGLDVALEVKPGEHVAILGPNGAGKSTLFNLVTRLYNSRSGTIRVAGHDMRTDPGAALRRLGVVFQSRALDADLTVQQNLMYHAALHGMPRAAAVERAEELLATLAPRRGGSLPLDLGRQARCFTPAQRAALSAVYPECAAEGCGRPFAWCEIHHDRPFHPRRGPDGELLHPGGGRTDHANGIPLCGPHHHRTEDPRYTYTTTRDERGAATVTFRRRRPGDPGEAVTR